MMTSSVRSKRLDRDQYQSGNRETNNKLKPQRFYTHYRR